MIKNMESQTRKQIKQELRKEIRQQKRSMTMECINEKSDIIIERLMSLPEYLNTERIYAYASYNQEVATIDFIVKALKDGKIVLVPKVYGEQMKFHLISSLEELKPGAYGIPEPDNEVFDDAYEGLMLLPGLAFDRKKHRMGYGGGFYDKYLMEHPVHFKVALAYDFQIKEEIPVEEFDVPADVIVTESRIIR